MSKYLVEALPVSKVWLGHAPHWDASTGKLFYVDVPRKTVFSYDPVTLKESKIEIGDVGEGKDSVSLIIPTKNDSSKFVIGLGRSLRVLEWDGSTSGKASNLKTLHTVDEQNSSGRFSNAKCDSLGRLWAGTMGYYQEGKIYSPIVKKGQLYRIDIDGSLTSELEEDVDFSNGTCWSPDNKTMYYVDSLALSVDAFDYDLASGIISNRRVLFDLKANDVDGFPHGMCTDVSGNLWVAVFGGSRVVNIDFLTGELMGHVDLPTPNITSVAFGGPNLDILYVTSAQANMSGVQVLDKPTNLQLGSIFKVTNLGVKGLSAGVPYAGRV